MISGRLGWRVSVLEIVAGLALGWALYVSFGLELSSVHESNGIYQAGVLRAQQSTGNHNVDLQHEQLAANLAIVQAVLRKVALQSKSNRPPGQAQDEALPWLQGPVDVLDRLRVSQFPSLPSQSSRSRSKEIAQLDEPMEALHVGTSDPIEFLSAGSQPGRGAAVAIITHIHVLSPFVRTWLNQAAALLSWRHAPGVRCLVATDSADVVIAVEALGCEALKGWVKTNGRGAALVPELLQAAAYAAPESPFIALAHPELMIGAGLADSLLALDAYEEWGGSAVRINASQVSNGLQPLTDGHLKGAPVATLRHAEVMDGYSGIDAMLARGSFGIKTNALLKLGGVASDSPSIGPVQEPLDGKDVRQQIRARAGLIDTNEIEALAANLPAGALPRVIGNLSSAAPPQQWSVKARPGSRERVGKLNDALEAVAVRGGLASAKTHKFIAVRNPAFLGARSIVQHANSQPKVQPPAEAGPRRALRRRLEETAAADQAVDPSKIRTDIRAAASKAASKVFGSMPKIAFDRLYWDRLTVQWLLGTGGVKGVPKEPSAGYSRVFAADLSASVVAVLPPPDFNNPKREQWSSFDWNAGDNKGGLKLDVAPESGPAGASACTIRQDATPVVNRPIPKPSRGVLASLQTAVSMQVEPANETQRVQANDTGTLQAGNATTAAKQRALQGSVRSSQQDEADIVEQLGPVEIKALLDTPLHSLSPDARDRVEAAAAERGVSLQEITAAQQMAALARKDHGMQAQLLVRELGWGAVWGEGSSIAAPCAAVLERFSPAGAAAASLREELLVR